MDFFFKRGFIGNIFSIGKCFQRDYNLWYNKIQRLPIYLTFINFKILVAPGNTLDSRLHYQHVVKPK